MTKCRTHYSPRDDMPGRTARFRMARCRAGQLPAESLTTQQRMRLVLELWEQGLTDVEIAARTRMTTYTTARIRTRIGLVAHTAVKEAAA